VPNLLGLIDRRNLEGRIPRNKWKAVDEKPGTSPFCMDAGWYQGSIKVVACDSQRSADLYNQATSKLGEVYEGAKIIALDWCDVTTRPRARIWRPAAIKAREDILFMLQECNPHLPTKDWNVAKGEEHEGDVNQAVLVLNKDHHPYQHGPERAASQTGDDMWQKASRKRLRHERICA